VKTCGVTEKTRRRSTASSSSTAMIRCASTLVRCALPDMIPDPPAKPQALVAARIGPFLPLRAHTRLQLQDCLSSSPWQRVVVPISVNGSG